MGIEAWVETRRAFDIYYILYVIYYIIFIYILYISFIIYYLSYIYSLSSQRSVGIEAWVGTRRAFDIGLNKEPAKKIYKIQRYTAWW